VRPRETSVLIGFADALAAPEVAGSLLRAGHRVASFSRRGKRVTLSRLRDVEVIEVTAPEMDLSACADELAGIASRYEVTMPLDDASVMVCDRALPANALLAGPRGPLAELALDKRVQLHGAAEAGFAVPDWAELAPGEPLPEMLGLPLVLKPALAAQETNGRLLRHSPRVVASVTEAYRVRASFGDQTPLLAQRYLRGVGAGVFGLVGAQGAQLLSAHRRVRMMNPAGSGSSACASTPVPAQLVPAVQNLLIKPGWRGMFMVELLRSGDDWWFMELNGRAWGSLALARRAGYEYPALAVSQLLDPAIELPAAPPFREILCRNLGREAVHLLFVLRGTSLPNSDWPGRWSTIRELTRPRAGTTWYNRAPELPGIFLYDAWRTLVDQTWGKLR
jgi:hypothetical protein